MPSGRIPILDSTAQQKSLYLSGEMWHQLSDYAQKHHLSLSKAARDVIASGLGSESLMKIEDQHNAIKDLEDNKRELEAIIDSLKARLTTKPSPIKEESPQDDWAAVRVKVAELRGEA